MNVLILSAGKRVMMVRYLQRALAGAGLQAGTGRVIAADCSALAPALYVADGHAAVPRADHPEYVDAVLELCERETIDLCLPSIDAELEPLARRASDFSQRGIMLMISPLHYVQLAGDKWRMHEFCVEHGIRTPRTWIDPDLLASDIASAHASFPFFTKPRTGAGSAGIRVVNDERELAEAWARPGAMVQEFMAGEPLDVDAYVDMITGDVCAISAKAKLRMRDGTADKTRAVNDPALTAFILDFCSVTDFRGGLDIDLFWDDAGYSLLEVNPRFGWAYAHSHECGADFISLMVSNAAGAVNAGRGRSGGIGSMERGGNLGLSYDVPVMARLNGQIGGIEHANGRAGN
ncbi:MAG: ATP-grasp domain-containing protein [Ancrocorticia sp.]|uniref:ATP-grasp domain-containing protein n=3 Tax=Ancrocorticia sp. TaxID=2593684 RepID=UPI003F8EB377